MSGSAAADVLRELAAELAAEDSILSPEVTEPRGPAPFAELVAAGPRTAPEASSYAAVIECIREGYLLHYGTPRIVDPGDRDLALLAGDYLYAKGLERLAAVGDLGSVRELSDLISLSAQLHAGTGPAAGPEVPAERAAASALWLASTVAVATGGSAAHERAKDVLRASGDARPLLAAAEDAARGAGLDEQLSRSAETVGFAPFHLG